MGGVRVCVVSAACTRSLSEPWRPLMTHCFINKITSVYCKGSSFLPEESICYSCCLTVGEWWAMCFLRVRAGFCETASFKRRGERQRGRQRNSQTARGTPQVLAQLALMDKSITPSFHATPDFPRVRCREKNVLSQVQWKELEETIKVKIEHCGSPRNRIYTKERRLQTWMCCLFWCDNGPRLFICADVIKRSKPFLFTVRSLAHLSLSRQSAWPTKRSSASLPDEKY